MMKSTVLLSDLGDTIDAVKRHISSMSDVMLKALALSLPSKAPAGTAEMLMLLLVYREAESRARKNAANDFAQIRSLSS
jgi:hypothetical protein